MLFKSCLKINKFCFKMDLNGYSKPSRHHHELLKLRLRRKFLSRLLLDNVNPREIREKSILICGQNEIDHKYFTLEDGNQIF